MSDTNPTFAHTRTKMSDDFRYTVSIEVKLRDTELEEDITRSVLVIPIARTLAGTDAETLRDIGRTNYRWHQVDLAHAYAEVFAYLSVVQMELPFG